MYSVVQTFQCEHHMLIPNITGLSYVDVSTLWYSAAGASILWISDMMSLDIMKVQAVIYSQKFVISTWKTP